MTLPFASTLGSLRRYTFKITLPHICALALAIFALVVYAPFLKNPLVFDDTNVVNTSDFFDYAFSFGIAPRWWAYSTLAHTSVLTDGSIFAMRAGNLFLHVVNVVAVFVLMREICLTSLEASRGAFEQERRAVAIAAFAAAVFAVHPLAVYGVGYLVQRTILMSTLFMLLMLIAYLRWLKSGRSALWVWSAVWYLLSAFSKEHSIMAPAVALLLTLVVRPPTRALVRALLPPFTAYAVIAVLTISMVKGVLGAAYEPYALEMIKDAQGLHDEPLRASYFLSVITQVRLFFKYLFLWIYPNVGRMSIDMREPFAAELLAWPYWAAAIAFVMYGIGAIRMILYRGSVGVAGWILAYPWLMFATELSAVRVQEPFVLYRTYLWFPVMGAVVAPILHRLPLRAIVALGVAAVCLLVPLSWNRLQTFTDPLLLWEDAAKLLVHGTEPGAGRIYYNRAVALADKGRNVEALADMQIVVKLHPKLAPVYFARARMLFALKRYAAAEQDMNKSLELDGNRAAVYFARGITRSRQGRDDEALRDFRKSCELKDVIGCYAAEQQVTPGTTMRR